MAGNDEKTSTVAIFIIFNISLFSVFEHKDNHNITAGTIRYDNYVSFYNVFEAYRDWHGYIF